MQIPIKEGKLSPPVQPYYPVSRYFKERLGNKTYKLSLSLAQTCPNRLGLKNMETCIFCDKWGSAAYPENRELNIQNQIDRLKERLKLRYKAEKFLIYLQAYTSTFIDFKTYKSVVESQLSDPEIVGFITGTRPDCISLANLKFWASLQKDTFVSIELGVQSFFDSKLEYLKRGHSNKTTLQAVRRLKEIPNLDICIHLMFGLPYETDYEVVKSAEILSQLGVNRVKLHNLHVLKGTELEKLYLSSDFEPADLDSYSEKVRLFLENLSPNVAVDRLAAVSNRWDELIAPEWTKYKMKTHEFILSHLKKFDSYQGKLYKQNIC